MLSNIAFGSKGYNFGKVRFAKKYPLSSDCGKNSESTWIHCYDIDSALTHCSFNAQRLLGILWREKVKRVVPPPPQTISVIGERVPTLKKHLIFCKDRLTCEMGTGNVLMLHYGHKYLHTDLQIATLSYCRVVQSKIY